MSTPEKRPLASLACSTAGSITQRHGLSTSASRRCLLKTALFVPPAMPSASCRQSPFYPLLADSSWRPAGPAVATALFALSLPMQGLWWLGKRSVTPLPPSILNWFYEVRGKLQEAGQALAPVEGKPDYQALADTLKRAFKQLDKTFLDDL